jgi:hypothetical protein
MGSLRLGQLHLDKARVLLNGEGGLGLENAKADPTAAEAESDGKTE